MEPFGVIRDIYEFHHLQRPKDLESESILDKLSGFKTGKTPYLRLTFGVEIEMLAFRADGSKVLDVKENILQLERIKDYNKRASKRHNKGVPFEYIGFDHYAENYDAHKNPIIEFRTAPSKDIGDIAIQLSDMARVVIKALAESDKGKDIVIVPCAIPFWKNYPNLSAGMHIHIGNSTGSFLVPANIKKWSSIFYFLACTTPGLLPRGFNGYSPNNTANSLRLDGDIALQLMHPGDWGRMLREDLNDYMSGYNEELDKMVPIALRKKIQTIEYRLFDTPLLLIETVALVNLIATLATACYNNVQDVLLYPQEKYKQICQKMWQDPISTLGYISNGGMDWKYEVIWDEELDAFREDHPLGYLHWLFDSEKFRQIWMMLAGSKQAGQRLGMVLDEFPAPYKVTRTLSEQLGDDPSTLMEVLFEFFKSWGYVDW